MPRKNAGPPVRGSREYDKLSAVTYQSIETGGVTIDAQGFHYVSGTILTNTEVGCLDGQAGYGVAFTSVAGYGVSASLQPWAGTTIQIAHGFTTLIGINAIHGTEYSVSGAISNSSPTYVVLHHEAGSVAAATVAAAVRQYSSTTNVQMYLSGGTIYWMAVGI